MASQFGLSNMKIAKIVRFYGPQILLRSTPVLCNVTHFHTTPPSNDNSHLFKSDVQHGRLLFSFRRTTSMLYSLNMESSLYLSKRNAGHSHWNNIRHSKAIGDGKLCKNTNYIIQKIRIAIKDGGNEFDPKKNNRLAAVIDEGFKKKIPKNTMTDFIKKMEKNKNSTNTLYMECKGQNNMLLIFEVHTEHARRTRDALKSIVRKYGIQVSEKKGFASYGFDHMGVILVDHKDIADLEKAEDIAVECDAEDVSAFEEVNGEKVFKFTCDPAMMNNVVGKISSHNLTIKDRYEDYVPKTFSTLTPEIESTLHAMFDRLDSVDEINRIFDNFEVESS